MYNSKTVIDHQHRISRVLMHIDRNIEHHVSLERLAAIACYSPFHFIRVFETLMSETPQQYIIRKRMERAGYLLIEKNQRIIDTAIGVGYETHNSFCKVFKNFYGMPPTQFRDNVSRDWFFQANRFYHPINGGYKPTASYPSPIVKTLPPIEIVYIENHGIIDGSFLASGKDSLSRLEQLIENNDLVKRVKIFVSIYPKRIFRLDDSSAVRLKGVIVDGDIKSVKDLKYLHLPSGKYAIFKHFGPYKFIPQTWNRILLGWFPRSRRLSRGSSILEMYLCSPFSQINTSQLSAYLLLPVH